tara:strand:+ start:534 stop:944 length:411 start_codon:yes stop_codon:yes gene_type:complete
MSDNSTVTMDPNAKVYEFARKKGKDEFATEFQHQYIQIPKSGTKLKDGSLECEFENRKVTTPEELKQAMAEIKNFQSIYGNPRLSNATKIIPKFGNSAKEANSPLEDYKNKSKLTKAVEGLAPSERIVPGPDVLDD